MAFMWQRIKNIVHLLMAVLANLEFGFPSRGVRILAITGTDGKTTTSTLLYHILKTAGKKVALISTVAAYIGNEEIDTGFHVTNPSPFALQKLLARTVRDGMEFVVLETTSHGLDQNRNWGITPEIAAITNITREHLDYHKTYELYMQTKAKLLTRALFAVLNEDDELSFEKLQKIVKDSNVPYASARVKELPSLVMRAARKRFGEEAYNFENTAVAVKIAEKLGVDGKLIAQAVRSFPGVKGRMEIVSTDNDVQVIVDFAHTPNALLRALVTVGSRMKKEKRTGRLIVVFGCAGLRDAGKRPLMGGIASEHADVAVFTAEDPRTEDIWTIISQMKSGVRSGHDKIVSSADRYEAIMFALKKLAQPGDTVLITGKGHERSMCYGTVEYDWSDQEAVQKVLADQEKF